MKIKGVIENFKMTKILKNLKNDNSKKIYLGLSLVLLWTVWGQFIFRYFLDPACTSQDLQAPSYVVGANYRALICCTCHFPLFILASSVCWSLPCLISALTQGGGGGHFSRLTCAVGREEHGKQISLQVWGALAVSRPHWVCPAPGVCAFMVYTAQALGCSAGNCLRRALGCVHFPGLSH